MALDAYLGGDMSANVHRSHSKFAQHVDGLRGHGSSSVSQAAADNNLKAHNIWVDKTEGTHSRHLKESKGASSPSFNYSYSQQKLNHVG